MSIIAKGLRVMLPRLGTAVGAFLGGIGMSQEHSTVVASAVIMLAGVGVDLLISGKPE